MPIDATVRKDDIAGFIQAVNKNLKCDETLFVAWQHDYLPELLKAMKAPNWRMYHKWPKTCPSSTWKEPDVMLPGSSCYDQVW